MKITRVGLSAFELPLKPGLRLNGKPWTQRTGLILSLTTDDGLTGLGEISPLKGFSRETPDQCLQQIRELIPELRNRPILDSAKDFLTALTDKIKPLHLWPSVRFGLELAVLHILAKKNNCPVAALLNTPFTETVQTGALLTGPGASVLEQAQNCLEQGFRTLKLKVAKAPLDDEIPIILELGQLTRDRAMIRLDANQGWDLSEAVQCVEAVGLDSVTLIEEPFKDTGGIPEFYHQTLMPVALDESLRRQGMKEVQGIEGVEALVLKPTLTGGLFACQTIAEQARARGMDVIISSSFESELGLMALAHLCAVIPHPVPAGLGTMRFFEEGLFQKDLSLTGPDIPISVLAAGPEDLKSPFVRTLPL